MKKIAIFSEGQTEQLFAAEVIKFLAAQRSFFVKREKLLGGKKFPTILMSIDDNPQHADPTDCNFYFLLIDCASDGRVVSAIAERYEGLVEQGYEQIIGMRDLAPSFRRDQLDRLMATANKVLPREPVDPLLVVAVMEVEAWFISEVTHFKRLDQGLTPASILDKIGIDLFADAEARDTPARDLAQIYQLVGIEYGKSRSDVERTIQALDIGEYTDERALARSKSLSPLFDRLTEVFTTPPQLDDQDVA